MAMDHNNRNLSNVDRLRITTGARNTAQRDALKKRIFNSLQPVQIDIRVSENDPTHHGLLGTVDLDIDKGSVSRWYKIFELSLYS